MHQFNSQENLSEEFVYLLSHNLINREWQVKLSQARQPPAAVDVCVILVLMATLKADGEPL